MKKVLFPLIAALLAIPAAKADDDDPPGRAARLSYLSGTVSFQPGSVEDWVPATLNRPMTTGDRLWTESGARAEMLIGSAAVRLDGRTNFAFLNLDDRTAQIQVSVGTVSVRLRRLADDESVEIDTPQMALTLLRPGEYRIEVNEQGDTTIAGVRGGEAEISAGTQTYPVHSREQIRVTGTDQPVFDTRAIPPADAFDNWCQDRDRREDLSESGRHVSRDIPGYADLDSNGVWREYPDYGWVWAPRVAVVDWAPYRYGHWAWIAPWGWTWVDDAPWGYAPFHYGRWVFVGGGWAWVPGPIVPRPVYAPAMVAWVGGANWSIGVSVGGPPVGWFPLGPREVWVPAYHHSPTYIERVNVTNTVIVNRTVINNVNVTNVNYVNRNVAGAVTVVPQNTLVAGRPVGASAVRVTPDVVARGEVRNVPAAAPDRTAVLGPRVQPSAAPPAAVVNRTIVARQTPPPPAPSFNQQQPMLRQNPGQPIPRGSFAPQATTPRSAIRQVGPPVAQPAPAVRPSAPAPVQAAPQPEFRRQPPTQQQSPQPEFRREPPTQQQSPQPEFRQRPAPQTQQPQTPVQQPEFRRPPVQRQEPQQQQQQQQPQTPAPQPEYRRPPVQRQEPQQQQQQQPSPRQQPEIRREPPPQTAPQSTPAPEVRRSAPPREGAPAKEAPRGQEKQKGRTDKDGKRND